jgi:hypothetical protein
MGLSPNERLSGEEPQASEMEKEIEIYYPISKTHCKHVVLRTTNGVAHYVMEQLIAGTNDSISVWVNGLVQFKEGANRGPNTELTREPPK